MRIYKQQDEKNTIIDTPEKPSNSAKNPANSLQNSNNPAKSSPAKPCQPSTIDTFVNELFIISGDSPEKNLISPEGLSKIMTYLELDFENDVFFLS